MPAALSQDTGRAIRRITTPPGENVYGGAADSQSGGEGVYRVGARALYVG